MKILMYILWSGFLRDKQTGKISNFVNIAKLDKLNRTYSILLNDYVEKEYRDINIGEELEIYVSNSIGKNDYNEYDLRTVKEDEYVENLANRLKEEMIYNTQIAYNNLDANYKEKKFSSFDVFEKYVKNNIKKFFAISPDKYQKTVENNYTQYVLLDTAGNYYIFKETAPMKYTLILDTYTIDIPEFTKKYEASNDQQKVILNINKFMLAINDGDYKYAYNTLADNFKSSNFKTQQDFESYIKSSLFEKNKFDYEEFKNEASTYYTYKVKITNANGGSAREVNKTFIMVLEEGTDFKLSFNIN